MSVIKTYGKLFEKKCIRPLARFFFPSLGKYKVKKRDAATDALHELAVAIGSWKYQYGGNFEREGVYRGFFFFRQ